jgi:ubiquinone/menaquinone biosynthesis C-methylase UbiE
VTGAPSDRLAEVYDRRAAREYAEPADAPDPTLDRKFEGVRALAEAHLPCEAFLDAGCGDGRYLAALPSPRPSRIVGTDISERILATARAAAERAGVEAELVRGNLEALPLEDAAFDLVLCTQVLEHLLDPAAGVRELARVLRPGGRVVLTTDNRRALVSATLNAPRTLAVRLLGRRRDPGFPHAAFTVSEVVGLVQASGLEVERATTFRFHLRPPLDHTRVPALQRALNRLDKALPAHRVGDIVAVVARRPEAR